MQYLFEYADSMNSPYEAFTYDTSFMPFPIRSHWHYFMEIIYMTEGTALVENNGRTYAVEPGDVILFHPESIHAIYNATNVPLKYEVLKFDVNKLYAENDYLPKFRMILSHVVEHTELSVHFKASDFADEKEDVKLFFERCKEELIQHDYGYDILVNSLLCSFMVMLIRKWRKQGLQLDKLPKKNTEALSLSGITEYIDAHVGEAVRVEDLALRCGMSYSFFAKKFKEYYGRSCKEYIELVRVAKAEDLLLFTDYDLSYISQEIGFSDSSHFIKTFRKWKHQTPAKYRNNLRS